MKKFIFLIIFSCLTLNCLAQWKGFFDTDSYTDEKIPTILYHSKNDSWRVYYQNNALIFLFPEPILKDNFDLWWNSKMESNGKIIYNSDIELNFIGNDANELSYYGTIKKVDEDDIFFLFGFCLNDIEHQLLTLLKNNNKLNIRFYNIVKEQIMVYNISLMGVKKQCKKVGL